MPSDPTSVLATLAALATVAQRVGQSDAWSSIEAAFREEHLTKDTLPPSPQAEIEADYERKVRARFEAP